MLFWLGSSLNSKQNYFGLIQTQTVAMLGHLRGPVVSV